MCGSSTVALLVLKICWTDDRLCGSRVLDFCLLSVVHSLTKGQHKKDVFELQKYRNKQVLL